jgi:nucleoside-diphosphate-sugar epimerase
MASARRVLITGIRGFIGTAIAIALRAAGYEVWGADLAECDEPRHIQVNLLDAQNTRERFASLPPPSVVIHAAALAHAERLRPGQSRVGMNTAMTENLLRSVLPYEPRFVFLSSVAVYGEEGRRRPVRVDDDLRPATDYGRSKLLCEEIILQSPLQHCEVLRLAPVYDDRHMADLRKRVFLPKLPGVKLLILPAPRFSLCHVDTVVRTSLEILREGPSGRRIRNLADQPPEHQHALAARFRGLGLPLPAALIWPFWLASHVMPRKNGYPLRCLLWKLFQSNVYDTETVLTC